MPFERPSLQALIERAASDIEARLPGTDARLRRSNLNVLARVHAGGLHGLYGYLAYMALQVMPDTAEAAYLERWASIWGVLRLPAAYAEGDVKVFGAEGAVLPAGAVLQRADGTQYITTSDATILAGFAVVHVEASAPGTGGNADPGVQLVQTQPVAGIDSDAEVQPSGISGGTEAENDGALRGRLLSRIQAPPHGGNAADYVGWAREVPGVTRAWCDPLENGPGTVVVRFVRDDDVDFIPSAGEVADVQTHIDDLRPVTANVTVVAPTAVPLDMTITLVPNTAAVRAAVEAELADAIRRDSQPGGTILVSHLREAISVAAGETNHVLTSPAADVTHSTGEIATLGSITWS